jgi:hypothetical protein
VVQSSYENLHGYALAYATRQKIPDKELSNFIASFSEKRLQCEKDSDIYLKIALFSSIICILKYFGVELNLELFGVKVVNFDNSLFFISATSLSFLTLSAMRAADMAFYERIIDSLCHRAYPGYADFASRSIYGGNSIHDNIMDIPLKSIKSRTIKFALFMSRYAIGLLILFYVLLPVFIGVSFVYSNGIFGNLSITFQSFFIMALTFSSIIEGLLALNLLNDEDFSE